MRPYQRLDLQLLASRTENKFLLFEFGMAAPGNQYNRYVTPVGPIRTSKRQPARGLLLELRARGKSYLLPMKLLNLWDGAAGNLFHTT